MRFWEDYIKACLLYLGMSIANVYIYILVRIGSLLLANPIKQDGVSKIKINPTCKCKIIICAWLMSSSVVPLEWRIIRATLEVRPR